MSWPGPGTTSWWADRGVVVVFVLGLLANAVLWPLALASDGPRPSRAVERLEKGARAYCAMSDEDRATVDRKLFYRLPSSDGVTVTVECAR